MSNMREGMERDFFLGMLIKFFESKSKLSKTDLKVYFNMYKHSNNYDYFRFDKYSDVEYLIGVDKHQFSKSIKKLVNADCVIKYGNSFSLIGQPPF